MRAFVAFTSTVVLAGAPFLMGLPGGSAVAWSLRGLATGAAIVGILVLARSTAIQRIRTLQLRNKQLLDEVTRASLYYEQLGATLSAVDRSREDETSSDPLLLVQRLMDDAATRTSAVFDSPVRLYLVHTTSRSHVVKGAAGDRRFGIEVGKSCPSDRPLDEVLPSLGRHWHIAPIAIRGVRHNLILLTERPLEYTDRVLVDHMALALSLADGTKRARSARTSTSSPRLHAV